MQPLAPISKVTPGELPAVIARMKERLDTEATPTDQQYYWTATRILMGLQYEAAFTERLLEDIGLMEESTTYQAILQRGENRGCLREVRQLIIRGGVKRFGSPTADVQSTLDAIVDLQRLEEMFDRLWTASSWADLLAGS